ncbi:carbohydrate ABC transporter permease [Alicyclobacillus macrosporangiidus]|uniref:carbohydrate ABC transporter permease n=1 Tax=Alicyclobacillus macrosporangiidus TaxID=392015 RepID=UPI0026E9E2CE|nr:carbohydrate ABC transporter permease [Alicyclobacillus macrosporangiidus]
MLKVRKALTYLLLIAMTFVFVLPFLWMLSSSLKGNQEIFIFPPELIPKHFMWKNYPEALTYIPFLRYLVNTLIISVGSVVGTLVSCPPVAYAFSRLQWRGRNFLFGVCLSTMMLPFMVTMIPLYIMFRQMHWINTFYPLIVPAFFGTPLYIFLMRQFYMRLPKDIAEAAYIDGAGEFRVFLQIITPLTKPALISIALFTFLANWTDFLAPLIFLNDSHMFTLSLGLQQYQSTHFTAWSYLMAACVVFTLPVVILFFALQRYFMEGISMTGSKG